ncbi:MAG TPA: glutamate--tRNA ligase [Pirellulales bacterium]|jgi:glutamyl-tRNA synthetase|nr:glutamate--tRNA ligase [Pirellulales bacterium]
MAVRTRFAPSPTGYLHIGGVRTALFCWLFARHHGGQFLLRIDDTDQQRNVEAALAPILHGFRWLGIDWDEGPEVGGPHAPYFQSQRTSHYQAAVEKLLASGHAYRDFATTQEIQAEREAAEKEKRTFTYSRRWLAETAEQQAQFAGAGRACVVRLKMPREGKLVIHDLIRGDVAFEWSSEQDHVIQRADGSCLYHLASVVDDHDFQISHVIRAEEHLSNTPRQIFIAEALGYPLPQYAHLPYVAEPGSKNKLSKRKLDKYLKNKDFAQVNEHGQKIAAALGLHASAETFNPVIVDFYEQVGYLPQAILNYLMLLGWSLDDKTEYLSLPQMIAHFSLERVTKAAASFDAKKLLSFQEHYMQEVPLKQKVAAMVPVLKQAGLIADPTPCEVGPKLTQIVQAAGDRIKVTGDILNYREFFQADEDFSYDDGAFDKRIRQPAEAAVLLEEFQSRLEQVASWDAPALEQTLQAFVTEKGIQLDQIIHSVRIAVTGKPVGFGLFDTLAILGKTSTINRIERATQRI